MTRERRLKREAQAACQRRGHIMTRFRTDSRYPRAAFAATCKRCHAYAQVLLRPWPNVVIGSAVALECDDV